MVWDGRWIVPSVYALNMKGENFFFSRQILSLEFILPPAISQWHAHEAFSTSALQINDNFECFVEAKRKWHTQAEKKENKKKICFSVWYSVLSAYRLIKRGEHINVQLAAVLYSISSGQV